jgi:hypothetical protein
MEMAVVVVKYDLNIAIKPREPAFVLPVYQMEIDCTDPLRAV